MSNNLFKNSIIGFVLLFFSLDAMTAINEIRFEGLEKSDHSFVTHYMQHTVGDDFNSEKWEEERRSLMNLNLFADVTYSIETKSHGEVLVYHFKELPGLLITPSLKRTDQDGVLLGPSILFINLFGQGIYQQFMYQATVYPELVTAQNLSLYTRVPAGTSNPFTTSLLINYFDSFNSLKLYDERSFYADAKLFYSLEDQFAVGVYSSHLVVQHDSEHPYFTELDSKIVMFSSKGDYDYIPGLGASLLHDTRKRDLNPHKGFFNQFKLMQYGEKLGGDWDYTLLQYDFRGYFPITRKQILHINTLARYRPGDIPAYELYHIGGVNSMRSYSPSPEIAGQHEALGTIEYRYEFFRERQISFWGMHGFYGIQLVAGIDNAFYWYPRDQFEDRKYINAVYSGIHLLVPVLDRIRLEWGAHDFKDGFDSLQMSINFGWYEKASAQRQRVR